jgi:hypothetical protein
MPDNLGEDRPVKSPSPWWQKYDSYGRFRGKPIWHSEHSISSTLQAQQHRSERGRTSSDPMTKPLLLQPSHPVKRC